MLQLHMLPGVLLIDQVKQPRESGTHLKTNACNFDRLYILLASRNICKLTVPLPPTPVV